jgi:hypothetical protein
VGVTGRGHRGQSRRGGADDHGSPTAPLLWGRGQGHEGGGTGAPGKRNNGATHRRGRALVMWRGESDAVAF